MSIDLEELRKITLITGRLSEVHIKTFEKSPFIFFDNLEKVEIHYDIKTDERSSSGLSWIKFELYGENLDTQDLLGKRVNALKKTVKSLLWNEIDVIVKYKGEILNE